MEYRHKQFDYLLYASREVLRDPDVTCAVGLIGPPGSGKTFAVRQLSQALTTNFGYISLNNQMTLSQLTGYADASGKFHDTDYTLTVKHGGVMLFDEADATGRPWITLNATIANRLANINGETQPVHASWIPVFSMNTYGRGPTPAHPDRMKLDAATISRIMFLDWTYDWELYREIAWTALLRARPDGADNETLKRMCSQLGSWFEQAYNYVADPVNGIRQETYFDPRAYYGVTVDLLAAELPREFSLEARVWKGLPKGTRDKILSAVPFPSFC